MDTTPRQRILVVDDEESITYVLKLNLTLAGYDVDVAHSAEQALSLDLTRYNLLLLDVMMGDKSGFELASIIRNNPSTASTPIIFCTALDGEDDLLKGFATGADDYIRKPFSMRELVARVESVLRRSTASTPAPSHHISYHSLTLDSDSRTCTIDGVEVKLTKTEFDLLYFLMTHEGKVFSRADLLDKVWPQQTYVVDRTIDVNINRLRKKLQQYSNNIITKAGYGYGFKALD